MANLVERIEQLPNQEAIGALDLVLQRLNPDVIDVFSRAREEERQFREAVAEPEVRQAIEARAFTQVTRTDGDDLARGGDLARSALVYLAEQGGALRDDVAHALDRPAPVGMRDPATMAIIGLVVLALRPTIDIQRDSQKGWTLRFKTEPLKDSAMANVLGKLLSAIFPPPPSQ